MILDVSIDGQSPHHGGTPCIIVLRFNFETPISLSQSLAWLRSRIRCTEAPLYFHFSLSEPTAFILCPGSCVDEEIRRGPEYHMGLGSDPGEQGSEVMAIPLEMALHSITMHNVELGATLHRARQNARQEVIQIARQRVIQIARQRVIQNARQRVIQNANSTSLYMPREAPSRAVIAALVNTRGDLRRRQQQLISRIDRTVRLLEVLQLARTARFGGRTQ
jgi:hypothetical protein